jgi:hypothetical protein
MPFVATSFYLVAIIPAGSTCQDRRRSGAHMGAPPMIRGTTTDGQDGAPMIKGAHVGAPLQ